MSAGSVARLGLVEPVEAPMFPSAPPGKATTVQEQAPGDCHDSAGSQCSFCGAESHHDHSDSGDGEGAASCPVTLNIPPPRCIEIGSTTASFALEDVEFCTESAEHREQVLSGMAYILEVQTVRFLDALPIPGFRPALCTHTTLRAAAGCAPRQARHVGCGADQADQGRRLDGRRVRGHVGKHRGA